MALYDDLAKYISASRRELQSAVAILIENPEAQAGVALLLARSWHALACLQAAKNGEEAPALNDVAARIDPDKIRFNKKLSRDAWSADLKSFQQACACAEWEWKPSRRLAPLELWSHCSLLESTLERAAAQLRREHGITLWSSRAVRYSCYGFAFLVLVAAIWMTVNRLVQGPPPWHAKYFNNPILQGQPAAETEHRRLDFDWGVSSPLKHLPADNFSANFSSCLRVENDQKAVFELGSDDGSRLKLDGEIVLDHWGPHVFSVRSAEVPLSAGVHLLSVEYSELGGFASLQFKAQSPEMLGRKYLSPPKHDKAGHPYCEK